VSEYRETGSGYSIGIVYLVGKSPDKSINKLLLSESNQHADLLYADYLVGVYRSVYIRKFHGWSGIVLRDSRQSTVSSKALGTYSC